MTRAKRTNPDFLNGVPELLVLRLLAQRPMYGYELMQTIQQQTKDSLQFGEGSIYPILHRLEAEGCLSSRRDLVNGRSRVVYRATTQGKKKLQCSVTTWESVVRAVSLVLQGGENEQTSIV